jgi:hypothetical protein
LTGVDGGRNGGYKLRGAILRVLDLEVMPMEQFLLTIAAGVVVALIVHWLGLNKWEYPGRRAIHTGA